MVKGKPNYSILDNLLEGCQIIDFDFRYIYINDEVAKQGRKSKEEMLGHTMMELYPGIETSPMFSQLKQCMSDRKPVTFENQFTYSDCTTAWFELRMEPVPEGVFILSCENSALKEIEKIPQRIITAAPFGAHTYELYPDGRLVLIGANKAANEILGIDHSTLIGKTIQEAFPALAQTEIPAIYKRVAKEGTDYKANEINYSENNISGSFEFQAVQISQNRMTTFFREITDLAKAYDETLVGWSRAMDFRDKETENHTQRVTDLTLQLAQAIGIKMVDLVHVRWGALLHDMGKLAVPDSILFKPDKLTDAEWVIMRKHPEFAYEMLSPVSFLLPALDIPYCHHEKWDGTGYPRGLKGEEIPLAARLFAVVDVWDALSSDRPYRKAWPQEKVLDYIKEQSNTHFDPKIVELFLSLMSKKTTVI
jgi:putative nucleotidyltransferase with HDIG domain